MRQLYIRQYFFSGLAHYEFLKQLKDICKELDDPDLTYMKRKADRSLTPRRPDFNRLYVTYKEEKYGVRNGAEMFAQLDQVIQEHIKEFTDASIKFQAYEEEVGEDEETLVTPFILVIVTEQMKRVHKNVSLLH